MNKSRDHLPPKWLADLTRLLPIRSQFVLTGNIHDFFLHPSEGGGYGLFSLNDCLWNQLKVQGFSFFVRYNPVDGISIYPVQNAADTKTLETLGIKLTNDLMPVLLQNFASILSNIIAHREHRIAVLIDYASRIPTRPNNINLSSEDQRFFMTCDKMARESHPIYLNSESLFNPVIWLAFCREDLPAWFGSNNRRIHLQEIARPEHDQRLATATMLLPQFSGYDQNDTNGNTSYAKIFADMTDSLTLVDMLDVAQMAKAQGLKLADIDDAVRSYKTGDQTLDNPWRGEGVKKRVEDAESEIKKRVRGQDAAIELAMDILKRSVMGLTGAHTSSSRGRPRGVLFLAGPTGVGKTELAKALTASLFGDEQAYIRFDMSEFSAAHADARLLGAPPGYVGYEAGGELTKAVRARPFCLLLFDEIEKANERLLDKFLQILEDGRITDGQGETVYFSESIIVFTSNLGIVEKKEGQEPCFLVQPGAPYIEVREKVLGGIRNHFTFTLGRPEILNRLGDNIVVFNFIESQIAKEIFSIMVENVKKRVKDEHNAALSFSEDALRNLTNWCTEDLHNGGRGIGNCLETTLINPLSRMLFATKDKLSEKTITVTQVMRDEETLQYSLQITIK
jgi:hypothetical protein